MTFVSVLVADFAYSKSTIAIDDQSFLLFRATSSYLHHVRGLRQDDSR